MPTFPASYYDAKKILRDLGLGYETIHVCKYDCALFEKNMKVEINVQNMVSQDIKIMMGKLKRFRKRYYIISN